MLLALLLSVMQTSPSLATVERLPPSAAGDLALAGRDHGMIETVERPPPRGPVPPGLIDVEMVERARIDASGCSRQRWFLMFERSTNDAQDAHVANVRSETEVATLRSGKCQTGQYVRLSGDIGPSQAFGALRHLDEIRLERRMAAFSCSDHTASNLCATPGSIRRGLHGITPWLVMRQGTEVIFWLGIPGEIVTELRYDAGSPWQVAVDRRVPAPF